MYTLVQVIFCQHSLKRIEVQVQFKEVQLTFVFFSDSRLTSYENVMFVRVVYQTTDKITIKINL